MEKALGMDVITVAGGGPVLMVSKPNEQGEVTVVNVQTKQLVKFSAEEWSKLVRDAVGAAFGGGGGR